MPAPIIVSRVRATLHRQGYQGFTQEQILEIANSLSVDINNPKPEDTKAVVTALKELNTTKSEIQTVATEETPINTFEGEIDYEALASLPKAEGAITPSQKREMVVNQAQLMGLVLAESDIQNIAQQVDFQTSDSEELIDEIKGFLVAFIQFRANQNRVKINNALAEVITFSNQTNREVSEELSTGLKQFAVQMEEQRNHFKSSVRSALRHLALPSTEA